MCPNCRAFITMADRVCPYCGVQLGPRAVDVRASQLAASFIPHANLTAIIILAINVAFYLLEVALSKSTSISGQVAVLLGAKYAPLIHAGQHWRLLTAGFLHGGFIHIFMNSWSLFILVTEVEQFYGTSRLIVAYIFSTVTGFYLSYLWSPGALSLGASAACFGLIGIMLAMGMRNRADPLTHAVRAHYGQWLIIGIVLSLVPGIDIAAHIGGFIGGFVVGFLAGLPGLPNTPKETLWRVLAGVALAVTVYAFLQDARSYHALVRSI
ncbi:MAG TPA: rhomboid family intramembrane serine protease [Bryobacteraceae bacterium]|jgi:rhomboid protease GluP|nr:rhomboid family intramembrane serine protease [Bryobacteraceae bacterium]